jgi:hypothetical protein
MPKTELTILDETMIEPKELPNNQDMKQEQPNIIVSKWPWEKETNPSTPPREKSFIYLYFSCCLFLDFNLVVFLALFSFCCCVFFSCFIFVVFFLVFLFYNVFFCCCIFLVVLFLLCYFSLCFFNFFIFAVFFLVAIFFSYFIFLVRLI